jgi:hypothetical protein
MVLKLQWEQLVILPKFEAGCSNLSRITNCSHWGFPCLFFVTRGEGRESALNQTQTSPSKCLLHKSFRSFSHNLRYYTTCVAKRESLNYLRRRNILTSLWKELMDNEAEVAVTSTYSNTHSACACLVYYFTVPVKRSSFVACNYCYEGLVLGSFVCQSVKNQSKDI